MNAIKICAEELDQQTSDDGDKDPKVVINTLDYDSLAKIIMLLPIPERIDMEKVCTKWKEACQLAWYDIKKYKCKLSIGPCYDNCLLTQSYLEKILSKCGIYLEELSLSDVYNLSIMPFVGDHCKNLTTLECKFDNSLIDNAGHFVQAFTQLDKLKCIKITLDLNYSNETINLSAIINSLPEQINEIHLFSKSQSIEKRRVFMTVQRFRNLQKLTSVGLYLDKLQEIADITTLVHLNTGLYNDHIHRYLSLFNKLVNLEYIDLTMGIEYYVDNLSTKILETIFCTCKNLKHLDIPNGPYDLAKIPVKKRKNFKKLQHLGISCNIKLHLADTIVKYCKNLKHLRIHNRNYSMNDTALKKLTQLENLECLILILGKRLSEKSITAISNNCKKLKRLEIIGCTIVSTIDGRRLFSPSVLDKLSKLQCLEHLNLCYAQNFTDSAIIAIANNCKNLKSLNILGITNHITETALVALTNLKNLQKLDVSFLNKITDSFLIKLNGLKELRCDRCKKLTNVGIIQLIKNNPDLEMISVWGIDNITTDMVIAADQATKNRTNDIILHIMCSQLLIDASKSIITSQWLVVE